MDWHCEHAECALLVSGKPHVHVTNARHALLISAVLSWGFKRANATTSFDLIQILHLTCLPVLDPGVTKLISVRQWNVLVIVSCVGCRSLDKGYD